MNGATMKYAIVAGAVFLLSTAALALGPGHGDHGSGGPCAGSGHGMGASGGMAHGPGKHLQALGLSPEQQKQLAALQAKHESEVAPVRAQMTAKRAEMQALFGAATPDRKAILAKHAEIQPLREKMQTSHVDFHLAVQKLLTPEQREQWAQKHGASCGSECGSGAGGFGGPDAPCGGDCP